jgi:dUTPase
MPILEFQRLHKDAKAPRPTGMDSEFNLSAYLTTESGRASKRLVSVRATVRIPTGLKIRPPGNHRALILTRKDHALRSVWTMSQAVESESDRELQIPLYNGGYEPFYVEHEDLIAHILILPLTKITIREVTAWE